MNYSASTCFLVNQAGTTKLYLAFVWNGGRNVRRSKINAAWVESVHYSRQTIKERTRTLHYSEESADKEKTRNNDRIKTEQFSIFLWHCQYSWTEQPTVFSELSKQSQWGNHDSIDSLQSSVNSLTTRVNSPVNLYQNCIQETESCTIGSKTTGTYWAWGQTA